MVLCCVFLIWRAGPNELSSFASGPSLELFAEYSCNKSLELSGMLSVAIRLFRAIVHANIELLRKYLCVAANTRDQVADIL